MAKTLVIGASGTVGSELAQRLAAKGHQVLRATSRAPAAAGQVQLNLVTQQGLAPAFEGVDKLFMLAPPGHTNQDVLLAPVIEQARRNGLHKVVLMSAMGANADDNAPLRKAELQLERSGLAWNVIRPNWFMQNFNTFWLDGITQAGKIMLPVGAAKGSFIDARDIAAVAAELLSTQAFDNRDFDLTGARALDHDEVAAILSRETGRHITFEDITPDALRPGLLAAQLPPDYVDFLLLILGYFKMGYSERVTDAVQQITGHAPRSIEAYAKDYRAAWV
jgi:uncharacterized protein YbjT (DUF2867 family)